MGEYSLDDFVRCLPCSRKLYAQFQTTIYDFSYQNLALKSVPFFRHDRFQSVPYRTLLFNTSVLVRNNSNENVFDLHENENENASELIFT